MRRLLLLLTRLLAGAALPQGAAGTRVDAFTGRAGATERAARSVTAGEIVAVRATRPFGVNEGLTVLVGWDPGLVARPGAVAAAGADSVGAGVGDSSSSNQRREE